MVARCNFIGCDKPDAQSAAKDISRWMAKPCQPDQESTTRSGRCLSGSTRRMEQMFTFGLRILDQHWVFLHALVRDAQPPTAGQRLGLPVAH